MSVTANFGGPVQTNAINRFQMLQSMARQYVNANQALTNAADVALSVGTSDFNTDGMWSNANPTRLTAPIDGKYAVFAGVLTTAVASTVLGLYLRKNGVTLFAESAIPSSQLVAVADIIPLAAGDYVEAMATTSGSPLTISADRRSFISMVYIGQ